MTETNCKVEAVSERKYQRLEAVDLIASGYEFECPNCGEYNTTHAIPRYGRALVCRNCKTKFKVGECSDAID